MTLPFPGGGEVDLVTKVGTSLVSGLRKASQLPSWPNTRDSLLELLAILDEWNYRAVQTSRYADYLAQARREEMEGAVTSKEFWSTTNLPFMAIANNDSHRILVGRAPFLAKLRQSSKRRAARRGLRTVLLAYCPDLLEEFESASTARSNWVRKYRTNFDRWFIESRTDDEVTQLLAEMRKTKDDLLRATTQLREFITANFPLARLAPDI